MLVYFGLLWWYFGCVFDIGDMNVDGIFDVLVGVLIVVGQGCLGLVFFFKGKIIGYMNKYDEFLVVLDVLVVVD